MAFFDTSLNTSSLNLPSALVTPTKINAAAVVTDDAAAAAADGVDDCSPKSVFLSSMWLSLDDKQAVRDFFSVLLDNEDERKKPNRRMKFKETFTQHDTINNALIHESHYLTLCYAEKKYRVSRKLKIISSFVTPLAAVQKNHTLTQQQKDRVAYIHRHC